jgi:hypothetical protein
MVRRTTKLIRHESHVAEVAIDLDYSEETWSPTMSLEDAEKLDRVRTALRRGDHEAAAKDAKVFELLPLAG